MNSDVRITWVTYLQMHRELTDLQVGTFNFISLAFRILELGWCKSQKSPCFGEESSSRSGTDQQMVCMVSSHLTSEYLLPPPPLLILFRQLQEGNQESTLLLLSTPR